MGTKQIDERDVHYKFAILAATAFYGPTVERSLGRPLLVRKKKADALWAALPEPERILALQALRGVRETEQGTKQ